jgi:phage-related protein
VARPGGKEVGRVAIRTVPDGTKFRKDLKILLDRAERTSTLSILVRADTDQADSDLRKFEKDWNGKKITFDTAVASAGSTAALKVITRPRTVPLIVKVSRASAVKAASIIAALSGARVAGDLIENLSKKLGNLDRALPKITGVTFAITSLTAALLASVGGIITLGGGLADVIGLAGALPGILGGSAVGAFALGNALFDSVEQLQALATPLLNLSQAGSDAFWVEARQPIMDFVNGILPQLRTGLVDTSTALGHWATSVVGAFGEALGGGRIGTMFGFLVDSINIAATGAQGFAQALVVLGQVGGSFLPRLAQWTADLSNQFGAFLLQVEASGELARFINTGIESVKLLASSLASIVSILGAIESAAMSAGGGGLTSFAAVLANVADAMNSPAFQTGLSTLFTGAGAAVSGLASALGPIGAMLGTLAPLISQILSGTGSVIGEVLGQIATALQSPAFQQGLGVFFEGLLDGIQAVAPALPALASALGTFLSFAGTLAGVLGGVLGTVLAALAPMFSDLLTQIQPLLPILGGALITALTAIAPVVSELVSTLLPPLVSLFSSLVPALLPIVEAVLPIISALLPPLAAIVTALLPILEPILSILTPIAELLGAVLVPILQILSPLFEILGGVLGIVAELLSGAIKTGILLVTGLLTGDLSGAVTSINALWASVWSKIGATFETVWNGILDFGKATFNTLASLLEGLVNSIIDGINGLTAGIRNALSQAGAALGIDLTIGKIPHINLPRLAVGADVRATPGGVAALLGEGGRDERVIDRGLGNKALAATIALAQRALRGATAGESVTPVYAETGELIAWIKRLANGEARLVFNTELGDLAIDLGVGG